MVKITNGSRTTIVTKGVFEEIYKPSGWKICDISKENSGDEDLLKNIINTSEDTEEIPSPDTEEEESESENFESDELEPEDEVEVPISEMKLDELKAYAAKHDIDISAAKTKQDIKAIIKAEMEA